MMTDISLEHGSTYDLADELKVCLEAALYDHDIEITVPEGYTEVPGFYPDNIKINKLAFLAIEDLGLPLVRTWYKYGQYEPYISLRAEELNPSPLKQPDKKVAVTPTGKEITRKTIYGYLQAQEKEIRKMWAMEFFEFMKYNYEQHAPKEFKDEYLNNTDILEILENVFLQRGDPWENYESFKIHSMNLRYELDSNEMIPNSIFNHVKEFLYSFEDALIAFEGSEEATQEQLNLLRSSRNVYHNYIWALPTIVLSKQHVVGPSSDLEGYKEVVNQYFENQIEYLPIALKEWKSKVESHGLITSDNTRRSTVGPPPKELASLERAAVTTDGSK